jgi:CarD family transcriptional regulator
LESKTGFRISSPETPDERTFMTKTTTNDALAFKQGDFIVYPAHGVGQVAGVESDTVAGFDIEVYVVAFEQDKMMLRVPTAKADSSGMRHLSSDRIVKDALKTLKGKARIKRTMWSRRAQEYEAKINSGDLIMIAEVIRDLHRAEDQPEQSYSERQLYESAVDRMTRELAAVEEIEHEKAREMLSETLTQKAA